MPKANGYTHVYGVFEDMDFLLHIFSTPNGDSSLVVRRPAAEHHICIS